MSTDHDAGRDRRARAGFDFAAVSAVPGRDAFVVSALYLALTLALTWPLAAGLTHDIAGDFGDPLFTSWALAWDATHLGRGWWNANIFAPHPLSLAYSEHFLPQALQVVPFYVATKNPILCYNLVFLSTFVLSGLGLFLLGRELTGSGAAGAVAGLAYAFAPYRIASIPHLQVLSSAWMPLVLFGLRRHFATGRVRPLAGAAAAWIVQNLSCGYYLLFFTLDLLLSAMAILLEGEDMGLLPGLFVQRILYRQLLWVALVRSLWNALSGFKVGWGKLQRTGTAQVAPARRATP